MFETIKYHKNTIKEAFSNDSDSIDLVEYKRREVLAILIILFSIAFLIPFSVLAFADGNFFIGIIEVTTILIFLVCEYLIRKKNKLDEVTLVLLVGLSILFFILFISPQVTTSGHVWSFLVPISIVFLLPNRKGTFMIIFFYLAILTCFLFDYPEGKYDIYFKVRYSGAYLALFMVAELLELIRRKNHESIKIKNEELQQIVDELNEKEILLKNSRSRYKLLFEESNDAIFIIDGLNVIELNKKMTDIFGYTEKEILNMDVVMLSPPEQENGRSSKEKAQEYVDLALKNETLRFDWIHQRKNGELFPCEINLHSIEHDNKKYVIVTLRDISYQKQAEKELIESKERAEKSDRLKSEFLAQMSHEIRTPINAIVNFSSLLKMDFNGQLDEDHKMCFSAIDSSANRLMRTINLILNMSEIESGTYEATFVDTDIASDIIEPIIKEFAHLAKDAGLVLRFENEVPPLKKLKVDTYTLTQSVANLVDNALKYTKKGKIIIKYYASGNQYLIEVDDTGIGISEEYLPLLFEKFSQEDQGYTRQFEGNGLGLALVKEYCNINNADIQVESVKGMGTKFSIILPDES